MNLQRNLYFGAFIALWGALILLGACTKQVKPEQEASKLLSQSRQCLAACDYQQAKAFIDSLRRTYPTALNAREEGILLLDSINLAESRVQLDSFEARMASMTLDRIGKDTMDFFHDEAKEKVRFFERKLQLDKSKKKVHP